jgi:hypothetical protein
MEHEIATTSPEGPARSAVRTAWIVALVVDALQIILLPLTIGGATAPLEDMIDVVTAILMTRLLGWHWAFLPTFLTELIPGLSLVPSWTLAVFIVTRRLPVKPPETGRSLPPRS